MDTWMDNLMGRKTNTKKERQVNGQTDRWIER